MKDLVAVYAEHYFLSMAGKLDTAALLRLCERERIEKHKSLLPVESWSRKLWQVCIFLL